MAGWLGSQAPREQSFLHVELRIYPIWAKGEGEQGPWAEAGPQGAGTPGRQEGTGGELLGDPNAQLSGTAAWSRQPTGLWTEGGTPMSPCVPATL